MTFWPDGMVVVRGGMTADEQVAFVSQFGRVLPQGPRYQVNMVQTAPAPLVTYVSNVREGGILGNTELVFHHDLAHANTPLAGISLYAEDVVAGTAVTRFADGRRAYAALPEPTKRRIAGLQAVYCGIFGHEGPASVGRRHRAELDPTWPRAVHPLVVLHPVSGEPVLYVDQLQAVEVLGLADDEGDALLDELAAHAYDEAFVHEHHWEPGDLVVWDNLVFQHARAATDPAIPRTLRRVVFGEKSVFEEWPAQRAAPAPTS